MENRAHAIAAGLFTILLSAGIVFAAMWFSGETYEKAGYLLESRLPVTGLNVQSAVRYRGVDVGKVEAIQFDEKDPRLIMIRIGVRADTPITRGTFAELRAQGVTGLSYVMLDDTGKKPEKLPPGGAAGDRIPVNPSLLENLADSGQDLVAQVQQVARRVNTLLSDENQGQFSRSLVNLEKASGDVASLARDLAPAVKQFPALTADARKAIGHADEALAGVRDLTLQISQKLDSFDRMAKSAEQVGGAAQSMSAALVVESLPRLNALVDQLGRTSRGLDRLMSEVKEQPQSVVFGRRPPPPGPGEPGYDPKKSD